MPTPNSSVPFVVAIVAALLLCGCNDRQLDEQSEEGSASETGLHDLCVETGDTRGVVDEAALATGVVVTLTDDDTRGEVTVLLAEPLPDVSHIVLGLVMVRSISILVSNTNTGSSADIGRGSLVWSALTNPGEFSFEVGDARCEVTLRFVNETTRGQSLVPGGKYVATVSISPNEFVESVAPVSLPVTVVSE